MLFFYIRHGDPIYDPDSLTRLGERQADALAKRLALYGIDKIYSSTSNRAMLTAKPTCELTNKEMTLLDFTNEKYCAEDFFVNGHWAFQDIEIKRQFADRDVLNLQDKWYEHPFFKDRNFKKGIERVCDESDNFFKTLGYEHVRNTGTYKVVEPNNERVALFAHGGFGIAFLSCMLDIPYPMFSTHFDFSPSTMTVIEFKEEDGYATPKILTLSSDSHLYREGLPTKYNNEIYF